MVNYYDEVHNLICVLVADFYIFLQDIFKIIIEILFPSDYHDTIYM